jgi:hypothetical protein
MCKIRQYLDDDSVKKSSKSRDPREFPEKITYFHSNGYRDLNLHFKGRHPQPNEFFVAIEVDNMEDYMSKWVTSLFHVC